MGFRSPGPVQTQRVCASVSRSRSGNHEIRLPLDPPIPDIIALTADFTARAIYADRRHEQQRLAEKHQRDVAFPARHTALLKQVFQCPARSIRTKAQALATRARTRAKWRRAQRGF